jgi:hypothetical protein
MKTIPPPMAVMLPMIAPITPSKISGQLLRNNSSGLGNAKM